MQQARIANLKEWMRAGSIAGLLLGLAACQNDPNLAGQRYDLREIDQAAEVLALDSDSDPRAQGGEPPETVKRTEQRPYQVTGEPAPLRLPAPQNLSSWTHFGSNSGHLIPHLALRNAPLTRVWATDIGEGNTKRMRLTARPVVQGDRIFVMDSHSMVSALNSSGQVIWQKSLVPAGEKPGEALSGGLAIHGGQIFATTGYGRLHALNAATGAVEWTQSLGAAATTAPAVDGGLVYVTTRNARGWAIDTGTGRIVWELEGVEATASTIAAGSPAVGGRLALFPLGNTELAGVLKQGGVSLWSASVSGQRAGRPYGVFGGVSGAPVISGDTIYAATAAGRLIALDAASGNRVWTALEGAGGGGIQVVGNAIFLISDDAELLRLNSSDGSRVWSATLPQYLNEKILRRREVFAHYGPILAGGRLITLSNDATMREVDPNSGSLIRVTELPGPAAMDPIVVGGTLYIMTADGVLHAYR